MTGLDPELVKNILIISGLLILFLVVFGQLFLAKKISPKAYRNYRLVLSGLLLLVVIIFNYYFGYDTALVLTILVIYALYSFLAKVWKSGERFRS